MKLKISVVASTMECVNSIDVWQTGPASLSQPSSRYTHTRVASTVTPLKTGDIARPSLRLVATQFCTLLREVFKAARMWQRRPSILRDTSEARS